MDYRKVNIDFEVIKPIGNNEGKNSDVFLAKDMQLNAELVVKQMEISKFSKMEEYFSEARILYDCKHPNIMEIQYASQDENYIYVSMPYHRKGSLSSLIDSRFLTVREIIKYSLDFLSGVAHIHSKGLVHLDIKPTNIILDETDRAILTDFGLSKYLDENGIANQPISYTSHWEPEIFFSSGRTVLSDIYQIGLTLYRLCNGNDILSEQMKKLNIRNNYELKEAILKERFPNKNYYLPHIPNKLIKVIKKSLELDASKRYNNVIQMMNDLSDIGENLDWNYTGISNELYYRIKDNNKISIMIKNKLDIVCTKTNLTSTRTTKMHKYCNKGYTSEQQVTKEIERIIKEND
ncbi:serine/threonine-protein kinase [Alloiococcus sp. CFN-8]|uniref:serine/threonine-protein kinase n=1 Tax=Alloiococcus sp. CFN-8 TaxID=3416081 RepID=UPI003CEF5ABD